MSNDGSREKQMWWALYLLVTGLVIELLTLFWNHHLSFVLFLTVGTPLIAAGAVGYLSRIASVSRRRMKRRLHE